MLNRFNSIAAILSFAQAYSAYLLHNDQIKIEIIQWVVSIFYIPLYFLLLAISGMLEPLSGLSLIKGGVVFPYLHDVVWLFSLAILFPINLYLLKRIRHTNIARLINKITSLVFLKRS